MSGGAVIPRVGMTLLAALVLDDRSDVPYADLERQRVLRVHAAQFAHERDHVLHGAVGQALHAHECPAASLCEAGDRPGLDSVKLSHVQPLFCSPPSRATIPLLRCPGVKARSQIGRTCSARGPLSPRVTVNSTRWLSWRPR